MNKNEEIVQEIGIVEINYSDKGKALGASFLPTMKVSLKGEALEALSKIEGASISDPIKDRSDLVLAGFFSKMNEIELADREEYEVASKIVLCKHHENGNVKRCMIKYFFQKRELATQ